jgi:hypothetical protein
VGILFALLASGVSKAITSVTVDDGVAMMVAVVVVAVVVVVVVVIVGAAVKEGLHLFSARL